VGGCTVGNPVLKVGGLLLENKDRNMWVRNARVRLGPGGGHLIGQGKKFCTHSSVGGGHLWGGLFFKWKVSWILFQAVWCKRRES